MSPRQLLIGCLACYAIPLTTLAQQAPSTTITEQQEKSATPGTGNNTMDARLQDMEAYARRYPEAFIDEVGRYLDVPRDYANALLVHQGWRAGDIWFACALAKVTDQSCRIIVRARAHALDREWGEVLNTLSLTLGHEQYLLLLRLSNRSYQHWARPLPQR